MNIPKSTSTNLKKALALARTFDHFKEPGRSTSYKRPDRRRDRAGALQDAERAADDEDEEDDVGGPFQAPGDRRQESVEADRVGDPVSVVVTQHAAQPMAA